VDEAEPRDAANRFSEGMCPLIRGRRTQVLSKVSGYRLELFGKLGIIDMQIIYGKNAGSLASFLNGTLSAIFLLTQMGNFDTLGLSLSSP
jgi:hypothetical protein